MKKIECSSCGASDFSRDGTLLKCNYCGSLYEVEKESIKPLQGDGTCGVYERKPSWDWRETWEEDNKKYMREAITNLEMNKQTGLKVICDSLDLDYNNINGAINGI